MLCQIVKQTGTRISWPSRLKIGAKTKKGESNNNFNPTYVKNLYFVDTFGQCAIDQKREKSYIGNVPENAQFYHFLPITHNTYAKSVSKRF